MYDGLSEAQAALRQLRSMCPHSCRNDQTGGTSSWHRPASKACLFHGGPAADHEANNFRSGRIFVGCADAEPYLRAWGSRGEPESAGSYGESGRCARSSGARSRSTTLHTLSDKRSNRENQIGNASRSIRPDRALYWQLCRRDEVTVRRRRFGDGDARVLWNSFFQGLSLPQMRDLRGQGRAVIQVSASKGEAT